MRAKSLLLAFLLMLPLLLVPVHAQEEEETSEVASLNLQAYAPARVVISYAYTNNFSVSDVSAMGKPEYRIVSGPTSIEFKTDDTDRFTFTVEIMYDAIVGQSIQIAVFSAGNPPEAIQLNVKTDVVKLTFTLTVTEAPKYPTGQEVAEQVVKQVSNQLVDFRRQTDRMIETQNRNIEVQWLLLISNITVSLALLIFIIRWIWPFMKQQSEAIASESESGGK